MYLSAWPTAVKNNSRWFWPQSFKRNLDRPIIDIIRLTQLFMHIPIEQPWRLKKLTITKMVRFWNLSFDEIPCFLIIFLSFLRVWVDIYYSIKLLNVYLFISFLSGQQFFYAHPTESGWAYSIRLFRNSGSPEFRNSAVLPLPFRSITLSNLIVQLWYLAHM
jgi:hypothetical protein